MRAPDTVDLPADAKSAGTRVSQAQAQSLAMEIVTGCEALSMLRPEYERLERVCANTLPFHTYEWHVAWCEHLLSSGGQVDTRLQAYVMREAQGACVGIVPLVEVSRHVGPLRIVTLELLGADPALTEVRGPIVAPGYEGLVAWRVQQALGRASWDWLHWTGIGGEFGRTLAAGSDLEWQEPLSTFVIDLPGSWEQLHARLKRNIRESLRHCYNSLRRDGLTFEFQVAREPAQLQSALERFLELHAMRAKMEGATPHPDHFATAVARRFLHAVCARLASRDAVRVFQLAIGGDIVASRVSFVVGGSLYLYYSGFDPAWARYSVMTTVMAEAIKYAIGQGLSSVNLSTGRDVSKTRWGPREVQYPQAFQVMRSPVSRSAYNLFRRARAGGLQAPLMQFVSRHARRRWT